MPRSYAAKVQAGQLLAARNQVPMHVFAIQRKTDGSGNVIRILDYGEMTFQRARNLVRKLDSTYVSATYMNPDHVDANVNGPKGYATWGVPIVKVEKFNKWSGLPE